MKTYIFRLMALSAVLASSAGFSGISAQESTAGGTLGAQASWTALQNMLTATNGNVSILRTDMNAMKACGAQKKIWTGTTCVNAATPPLDTSLYDKVVACGDQGKIYDKSSNSCVNGTMGPLTCTTSITTYQTCQRYPQKNAGCPSGYSKVRTDPTSCGNHGDDMGSKVTCQRITCS